MSKYEEDYAEIDGRIYLQATLLMPQGNSNTSVKVFSHILQIQHKLRAMLYHKNNLLAIENTIIEACITDKTMKAQVPSNIYYEFEAFLFQTKSALDITIKILKHLEFKDFRTDTFQNKGEKLISNLEEYKKKIPKQLANKIENQERLELAIKYRILTIDNLISMLKDDRTSWLCKTIDTRDTVSHYKGSFSFLNEYTVEKIDDEFKVSMPKILGDYPRRFLDDSYSNCIQFIQDFICLFIELWLPPFFVITAANDSDPTLASWRADNFPQAKYIKYIRGSREWV